MWVNAQRDAQRHYCPPMRAHWRHLANTIEIVLPSIHPSLQCKLQIDRFSHFRTVHGGVSSGMPCNVLSPNYCPFASGIWAPPNTCFLGPSRVHNPNGIWIGSVVFAQITAECRNTLQRAVHSPPLKIAPSHAGSGSPSNPGFLEPIRVHNPNGISIGWPFLHR